MRRLGSWTSSAGWRPAAAMLGLMAHAAHAAAPLSDLLACRELTDSGARLACFDRAAAALAGSPPAAAAAAPAGGPPAAPAPAPLHPAPVLDPQQQFGLPERTVAQQEVAAGTRAADAAKIEAHIVRMVTAADGRVAFTLDNSQVWIQLEAQGELLTKPGEAVTISRGWLGSYWMQPKSARGFKVSRLH